MVEHEVPPTKFLHDVEKRRCSVAARKCDVMMQDPVAATLLGDGSRSLMLGTGQRSLLSKANRWPLKYSGLDDWMNVGYVAL